MLIKKIDKMRKKHPNFDKDMELITPLVDCCIEVFTADLLSVAQSIDNINWDIKEKKYLTTFTPKSVECRDVGMNGKGFSEEFDKNTGNTVCIRVDHPELLRQILGRDLIDYISIANYYGTSVTLRKSGVFDAHIELENKNGQPMLIEYSLTVEG